MTEMGNVFSNGFMKKPFVTTQNGLESFVDQSNDQSYFNLNKDNASLQDKNSIFSMDMLNELYVSNPVNATNPVKTEDKQEVKYAKTAELPDKVKNLVVNKTGNPADKEKVLKLLSAIYADPDGKKLIDKMAENGTKIEIVDHEKDELAKQGYRAYYESDDNKIVIFDNHIIPLALLHEMGHSVTGQEKNNSDGDHNSFMSRLKNGFNNLKDKFIDNPTNDDDSFAEELGTTLMAEEIIARMEGRELTAKEARDIAKTMLKRMLSKKKFKNGNLNLNLMKDNNFYKHIADVVGVKIANQFDVQELYNELKREDKENDLMTAPQLE